MTPYWQQFLDLSTMALLLVCAWMLLLWLLHLPLRNASIVDAGWTFGIGGVGIYYAWSGPGAFPRKFLLALMVGFWAARLGLHLLFNRIVGHPEEGRYQELRRKWGGNPALKFLLFFQMQAVSCVVLAVPLLLACMDDWPELRWTEKAAALLWVLAMSGEAIADMQLNRFKGNQENRGKVCREGLWAWSRHPNYFFEWLIWLSYALYAVQSPWGWLGFLAPALMLHFVLNVTGIPPTEEQAVRSKGEAYRAYQREVSAFVPLPPKERV
jgi:steroid 5-alpha reductase family enzyme